MAETMKNVIHSLSLVMSAAALVFACMTFYRAEAVADEAVDRRGVELLVELQPKLQEIYADFDMPLTEKEKNPETLEDALSPLIRLLESLM